MNEKLVSLAINVDRRHSARELDAQSASSVEDKCAVTAFG